MGNYSSSKDGELVCTSKPYGCKYYTILQGGIKKSGTMLEGEFKANGVLNFKPYAVTGEFKAGQITWSNGAVYAKIALKAEEAATAATITTSLTAADRRRSETLRRPVDRTPTLHTLAHTAQGEKTAQKGDHSTPEGWLLARPDSWSHGGNAQTVPKQWAMQVAQFSQFINACKQTPLWAELKQDRAFCKQPGHVNAYQVCKQFVEPFTSTTGCSVSLLLNPDVPKAATVMVSHTWHQDMHQVYTVFESEILQGRLTSGTAIWFCVFSICD